jgi:hypothetical protein
MADSTEFASGGDVEPLRTTLRLSPQARHALNEIKRLAKLDNAQDAVRRSISDELFLLQQRDNGWKVILQKGNEFREVVWPTI